MKLRRAQSSIECMYQKKHVQNIALDSLYRMSCLFFEAGGWALWMCIIFLKGTSLEAPFRGLALSYYVCIICLYFIIVLEDEREEVGGG